MREINSLLLEDEESAFAVSSSVASVGSILAADITVSVTDTTPADTTFTSTEINTTTDKITIVAHGYLTGLKASEITTTTTLPGGISASTAYYVIRIDNDTIQLALSQSDASAGTAVDITSGGSGTHTLDTALPLSGSILLQKNNEPLDNDAIWVTIPETSTIFGGSDILNWAITDIGFRSIRLVVVILAGQAQFTARINAKGDR